MSAPLRLTSTQLRDLSSALNELTKVRKEYGIDIGGYGMAEVTVLDADVVLQVSWADDESGYYIDDRRGS